MATTNEENPLERKIPEIGEDEFHVFLTYHKDDADYASILDEKLMEENYKVFLEERDRQPEKTDQENIEYAVKKSLKTVAVVSRKYVENNWEMFQTAMALHSMNVADYTEQQKKGRITLIPILYNREGCSEEEYLHEEDIPPRLAMFNFIHSDKEHFEKRLFTAIKANLTLADALPAGNVAHGLAWSYFYGYLNLILKGLPDRIKKCAAIWNDDFSQRRVALRMFIIIPKSCFCPPSFKNADSRITDFEGLEVYKASRAGNPERPYPAYSKKIKMENGEEYFFVGEFATPVLSMYEMEIEGISGLKQAEKYNQVRLFYNTLKEILNHPTAAHCHGRAELVFYDDEAHKDGKKSNLADHLVEMIKAAIAADIEAEKSADEF